MSVITYPRGSSLALTPHFKRREFDCPCGKCSQTKHDPALSAKLEQFRVAMGEPVTITSGYRCPAHNAAVGGTSGSKHKTGAAADIKCGGSPVLAAIVASRYFGGVGIYWYNGTAFIHVDTRLGRCRWLKSYVGEPYRYTYGACPLPTIRMGVTSAVAKAATRMLQRLLGIKVTGTFDAATKVALQSKQAELGIPADGVCGPQSWAAISGADKIA